MEEPSPGRAANAAATAAGLFAVADGRTSAAAFTSTPAVPAAATAAVSGSVSSSSFAATAIRRFAKETAAATGSWPSATSLAAAATPSCVSSSEKTLFTCSSFSSSGAVSTPRHISSPPGRLAAAAEGGNNMFLLLDDKVLLLLLSFLTLQQQTSFLRLTRRVYAAALRLPFVKHLLVLPPGNAFDIFHQIKGVSFFPPHPLSPPDHLPSKPGTAASRNSSKQSRARAATSATRCSSETPYSSVETRHTSRKTPNSSRETSYSSSETPDSSCSGMHSTSTTCISTMNKAIAVSSSSTTCPSTSLGSSSAGVSTSSSRNHGRLNEHRSLNRSASTISNSLSAVFMRGACPCCCIPVCFFHFSQLESADIAAPALVPPSPLLALLLLLAARSLKHLRVRGVDEGSFSWKASQHTRLQQQQQAAAEQIPQWNRQQQMVGLPLQQPEKEEEHHHPEAHCQGSQRQAQQVMQLPEKKKQPQSSQQPSAAGNARPTRKGKSARTIAIATQSCATATESPGAAAATAAQTAAAAGTADGIAVDCEESTHAAPVEAAAVVEAAAAEGGDSLCRRGAGRKRVRLKEDEKEPASEGACSWEAMLVDSLRFAATAAVTPAVLTYMQQLHRRSIKRRDVSALREGYTVSLFTEGGKQIARSPVAAATAASEEDVALASFQRSCVQQTAGLMRSETAAPGVFFWSADCTAVSSDATQHSGFPAGKEQAVAVEEEEEEEEERRYWLPKRAVELLLTSALKLETLALDVSRRKGMFRVTPLARLFLLEEEDRGERRSNSTSSSNNYSSFNGCGEDQQQQNRPQHHCYGIVNETLGSAASATRVAGVRDDCTSRHGQQRRSSLPGKNNSTRGRCRICRTPTLSGEVQQTTCCCQGERDDPFKLLMEAEKEALSLSRGREGKEAEKKCCRLRELEVCNITPTTFVCGYISLPQLRILKLHFVEIASGDRGGLHDLGGLLQGCPLLEDFAVHTDSDDDQMVFLNRLLIRSFGRFLKARKARGYVLPTPQPVEAVQRDQENRKEVKQQQDQQQEGEKQTAQQNEHQQQARQQGDRDHLQQHDSPPLLSGPGSLDVFTNAGLFLLRECDMVLLDEETIHIRTLRHLKSFQTMLLDIRVIDLLAQAAPNLQILRLIEMEAFRSSEGRSVLIEAVRRLPRLRRVELLGDLSETEGCSTLKALLDAEARARDWPPGVLSLHHGAEVIQNFFLPSL